ncbi:hypothetical protein EJ05DRAFT_129523 [Pseudovirgaria hyperparasitica]|uniref:Glc8 protein n=1 Tax=Pseudovirgaria hyperparasitica TaxID=470096 RepID=A0A6A6VWS9_9PEZI|nr:uncharacterized protein EJ05DRAFT_129523 [Pseudovirgaria hyperparasitica]KAF2754673.1 hypothetical protein EJ05DRAFT_129523 [Pseudovirgaria hyperparasitica]
MTLEGETAVHSPPQYAASPPQRPRGILKNSDSFKRTASQTSPPVTAAPLEAIPSTERPDLERQLTEKEIVMQNTMQNAGPHRRSSSNPRGPASRRQSGTPNIADENSPRLKWDEANLYLNEQQQDSTMKITEPKTPYAKQYDPSEDEEEISMLDANQLNVDELDSKKTGKTATHEDDIPGLDIGEPEIDDPMDHDGEKKVLVDEESLAAQKEEEMKHWTPEEKEKHRKFEETRRKHYEMKNVKDLLGHPENIDEDEDEEGDLPQMPNGQ